ncbi:MAG TPA: nucleoside phosphorylase [Vicinamibacterales bacterium]|nr:nucleoside phosphorylase [Vicinamibacterales bacterium]
MMNGPETMSTDALPLFQHALESPSAFTPERLMDAVRAERGLAHEAVPPLCVLDFDGDLSDHLAEEGATSPMASWACFHTSMRVMTLNGLPCGIVPRTIGGPYAVLVAEQLWAAGAKLIVGITSAGRVSPTLPLPSIVVVDEAVRDEGTSLHYAPPSPTVVTPTTGMMEVLLRELSTLSPCVCRGPVWTTDAPYRETPEQLRFWAEKGVLAVEMQSASLFAFAHARGAQVAMVALVSNGVDDVTGHFDTGGHRFRVDVLTAVARAAQTLMPAGPRQVETSPAP